MPARIGDTAFVVVVGQSLATQGKTLADLREAMLITLPIALLVASIGGYILARKSLTPVLRMSAKARAITADFGHQLRSADVVGAGESTHGTHEFLQQ